MEEGLAPGIQTLLKDRRNIPFLVAFQILLSTTHRRLVQVAIHRLERKSVRRSSHLHTQGYRATRFQGSTH